MHYCPASKVTLYISVCVCVYAFHVQIDIGERRTPLSLQGLGA